MLQTLDYLLLTEHALEAFADHHEPSHEQETAEHLLQQGLRCGLALLGADRAFAKLRTGEQAELKFSPALSEKIFLPPHLARAFLMADMLRGI